MTQIVNALQYALFCREADKSPGPLPCRVVELPHRIAAVREHELFMYSTPGLDHPARDGVQYHHALGTGLGGRCR